LRKKFERCRNRGRAGQLPKGRAPPGCRPRKFTKNFEPRYTAKNELNSDFIIIPAEKGRMLIWPSHVPHAVEQGMADETEDRITVPFNIMIRGRIELFTASLNLS
jgi:Putative 2OG-Fe(II) oxygenase